MADDNFIHQWMKEHEMGDLVDDRIPMESILKGDLEGIDPAWLTETWEELPHFPDDFTELDTHAVKLTLLDAWGSNGKIRLPDVRPRQKLYTDDLPLKTWRFMVVRKFELPGDLMHSSSL